MEPGWLGMMMMMRMMTSSLFGARYLDGTRRSAGSSDNYISTYEELIRFLTKSSGSRILVEAFARRIVRIYVLTHNSEGVNGGVDPRLEQSSTSPSA